MNKQNFTSKFSNILEEEQNQSREMNGGETKIWGQKEGDSSCKHTAEKGKSFFPLKSSFQRGPILFKNKTK